VLLRVSLQLTPLQFYYSLQSESQLAVAAVVMETAEDRSPQCSTLSSCGHADVKPSCSGLVSRHWKPRRPPSSAVVAKTDSGDLEATTSSKLQKRKQALSKASRHSPVKPRPRDAVERTTTKGGKNKESVSDFLVRRGGIQKCDSGEMVELGETERTVAVASEKHCCGDGQKTGCSTAASDTAVQPRHNVMKHTSYLDEYRKFRESSASKSLPPASTPSPPVAVSKLKIFKCSESKKLCVRSADVSEQPPETFAPLTAAVRRSGVPVGVHGDDKHERRRRRRRRLRDKSKTVADRKTIVDQSTTVTDVDTALSPVPSVPDATEDATADCPTDAVAKQQISSPACSPMSSSDNVVSSSTSSRLLPDDEEDDDNVDGARRAVPKSRPRRTPGDAEDVGDDGKSVDQTAVDGSTSDSATTLRVPIRLGGQSGQTGELLLRLPQNVSVQCSFRADQILIASSPATTSTEQSMVSTDAGVERPACSDADLLASQHEVSDLLVNQ